MITSYSGVFAEKLAKQKEAIKKELKRAKSDRRKDWLKDQLKRTKKLRNILKDMEKESTSFSSCPHCGKSL